MKRIFSSITDTIGNTPMVELSRYSQMFGVKGQLIAKLEYFNPGGSVKDRVALAMIEDAENRGLIKEGFTIIEPTSGNTGIGLAMVSAVKGYKLILTMPETMSIERRKILSALGAEIVLTEGAKGMNGAIARSEELHEQIKKSIILRQFENSANPNVHQRTTAQEIWNDCDGTIDCLVCGVGTGGTISGSGKALKALNSNIRIVAVEPADSPVLSGGKPSPHKLQGIGAGFIPKNYDATVVDEVVTVTTEKAYAAVRELARCEGIMVGISSGAALYAATEIAKQPQMKGKTIVVILPDGGERYLSTELYQ